MSDNIEAADSHVGLFSLLEAMKNALAEDVSDSLTISNNIGESLSACSSKIYASLCEEYTCPAWESMEAILAAIDRFVELCTSTFDVNDYITIDEKTAHALQEVAPLIPEEKREEFQKIVTQENAKKSKILSAENIKWLLGIILPMLFTLYIHSLPDKNAEEHLRLYEEQNIIEQSENESISELTQAIENLFDCLNNQEIKVILQTNVIEDSTDAVLDRDCAALEIVDETDDLIVSESQNNDAHDQNDVQDP